MSKTILIVGYYGAGNAGDEAILRVLLETFRKIAPGARLIVPAEEPERTRRLGVESFSLRDLPALAGALSRADLVVAGGGGLFHDLVPPRPETLFTPAHFGLTYYCGIPWLASELGKRVAVVGAGVGPLLFPEGEDLVRSLAEAAEAFSVRDEESARALAVIGVPASRVRVTADLAWRFAPRPADAATPPRRWLGLALRPWGEETERARWLGPALEAAEGLARREGLGLLFLPFQRSAGGLQDDVALARATAEKTSVPARVLEEAAGDPHALAAAIARCEMVVGMRLHSLVLSCLAGTPFVGLAYDPKVASHAKLARPAIPCLDLGEATKGTLAPLLRRAWRDRAALARRERSLARRMRARSARDERTLAEALSAPAAAIPTRRAEEILARMRQAPGAIPLEAPRAPMPPRARSGRPFVRIATKTFFDPAGSQVYLGGGERYLLELAGEVESRGYRVEVVQHAAKKRWRKSYRGIEVVGLPPADGPFAIDAAIARELSGDPALTLYHSFFLAGEGTPPRSIGISHGIFWDDASYQGPGSLVPDLQERVFRAVETLERLVSVDTNTINWLRAHRAELAGKCLYVPNFVDLEEFRPARRRGRRTTVLYPRRLYGPRGFWLMAEVVPSLLRRFPDVAFRFAGQADEAEAAEVRRWMERAPGRVSWAEVSPARMHGEYARADIAVIPTVSGEGTSLSCLEAMASGCAVVATHVGGLSDLILPELNGLQIAPEAGELEAALARLIGDRALRGRLARNARESARYFSRERWARQWSGLLDEFLPHLRPARRARSGRASPRLPGAIEAAAGAPRLDPEAMRGRIVRLHLDLAAQARASAERIAELEQLAEGREAELARARDYVGSIQAEREATVAGLNAALAARTREAAGRERDLAEAARARQEASALLREKESALSSLRDRLRASQEEERATETRRGEIEQALASAKRSLETERSESGRETARLQGRIESLREELRRVSSESLARHEHLDFAVHELERRAAEASALRDRLETAVRDTEAWQKSFWASAACTYWALRDHVRHPGRLLRRLVAILSRGGAALRHRLSTARPAAEPPLPAAPEASPPAAPPPAFPAPRGKYDIVVFSIVDWDFRFQRPQQIATQFARAGHRVYYLSTTRFPGPEAPPFQLTPKGERLAEVQLRAPHPLNVYSGELTESEVDHLEQSLAALASAHAIGDAVAMVQVPFWAPLARRMRKRFGWRVVYDCMDEWTNFPGIGASVLALEEGLVRDADVTILTADRLRGKWENVARASIVAKNGIDLTHYRERYGKNGVLSDVCGPVLGYFGALASWLDVALVERVARAYPHCTVVLAGGHFDVDLAPLAALPNVRLLGQRPYEEMPRLLWRFDVCLIPFVVNEITEATNPVKFYEYLFSGKPIVAPALTELEPHRDIAYLARDADDFVRRVAEALAEGNDDPRREARRRVAAANDWAVRREAIAAAVDRSFPAVSVVVVTFGGLELTRDCLESLLLRETWPSLEVIVVDNASSDGTPAYLREIAEKDARVRVILNPDNRGFAAANNQGIAQARGDFVILLNNDTVVPPGLVGRLVRHLEGDPSIGLLCPTTNFCGNEAKVEPDYAHVAGLPAFAARRAQEFWGRTFDIEVAAMYCVAARRAVLEEVGPLDESFGIGMFEDDDYAIRVRQAGYRVACAEDAYVHHVGQGSFRRLSPQEYQALWLRNQEYFERKWDVEWKPHRPRPGVEGVVSEIGRAHGRA